MPSDYARKNLIHILFIVPYPELREKVELILEHFPERERLDVEIRVKRVEEIEDIQDISFDLYDVVIARGYSAIVLSRKINRIPVIRISVSAYDVISAISEAMQRYSPKRIALLGTEYKVYETEEIAQMLRVDLKVYDSVRHEDLGKMTKTAKASGCECIIGGYSAVIAAAEAGLPAVVLKTGENAVLQSLEEAVRTVDRIHQERLWAEMYKTIIYSSQDGILYVDQDGIIRVRNRVIRRMNGNKSLENKPIKMAVPYLYELYKKTLESRAAQPAALIPIPDTKTILSVLAVPVIVTNELSGVVLCATDITKIQNLEGQIRKSLSEKGLKAKYSFSDILHRSDIMQRTIDMARQFARSDSNTIIVGETGTGKELFAQSIHNESARRNGPFVVINCAALPENLLESELFGYAEGAFTGASKGGKMGLFEQAHNGTLFLDEIGEISLSTQTKLLRVLQEKQVRRIGDNRLINVDVRIISATNKNLNTLCKHGHFRRDLMYRLDVLRLFVPPLRERGEDIELLFRHLIEDFCKNHREPIPEINPSALSLLYDYPFTGNIRELQNIAERLMALRRGKDITKDMLSEAIYPKDLEVEDSLLLISKKAVYENEKTFETGHPYRTDADIPASKALRSDLESEELHRILDALRITGNNQSEAAKLLGINRSTLWRKLKKFQIK